MNVLKTDFVSKQRRLQGRRKKVIKTFFSGYHTIANILPSAGCFKAPMKDENNTENKGKSSPKSPIIFSHTEILGEPRSIQSCSVNALRCDEAIDKQERVRGVKDSTTSTSLEFQKILEPFLSFREGYLTDTSEEHLGNNAALRSVGKPLLNLKVTKEKCLDSSFHNQDPTEIERNMTTVFPVDSINFSKNTFAHYNVFNLSVPKNQKSIDEMLNTGSGGQFPISEEGIRSPTNKIRGSKTNMKTPKTRGRKSPKTSGSNKTVTSDSGTFIIAVTEGRGHARGEVGMAAMDPNRPHLVLCQISDSQNYVHSLTKMNVFDFVEVIVPNTFVDCASPNKLYSDIRSTFPKVTLTSVQRRHFNESIGMDFIRQYCSPESISVMVLLRDKFYALSAAAALIKYVEFTQSVRLAPQSLRIEYQGMEDTMIIDINTANLLELVMCVNHPETNFSHSLLGVINYCHTKGGVRLLRANILQPPCSLTKIETRLDCVSELVNNPLLLCALEAAVSSFSNLEDLLNLCMHAPQQDGLRVAEYQLKYTLLLKSMLEFLPMLRTSLNDAKSQFFCEMRKNLEDPRYFVILERILQSILENAKTVKGSVAAHLHGCFAIKTGINSLLDIAKKTYCEIVQEISAKENYALNSFNVQELKLIAGSSNHVSSLREKHSLPLRLAFSANKGFHIQYTLPPGQRSATEFSLPKEFILAQKSKCTFSFYTAELVALDQRSQHVLNEIKLMTNVILFELLTDIRQHVGCLFNLCEYIAELDVLISFAHVGSGANYVRPKFGDRLDLKDSRHPILDVIHDGEVVPNNVFAKAGKNFTILTGPNQSGKSIYIRQVALIQIMAQMGCYVPAKEATFRLADRIFSRIGFDDSIESNASTLIVEMRDVEYLKQNKTPRSLVIIDELCRGTSVEEGTSLAFAICEELLDTSTFVFFTTHYLFLTKLEEMYFNVNNYHFESKVGTQGGGKPSIEFTHVRAAGATQADSYGLQVAEMTSFPKDVYYKAKEIAEQLSKDRKPCRVVNGLLAKYQLSLQLRRELIKLESEMSWQKMESVVQHFKQLYEDLEEEESLRKNKEKVHSREEAECSEDVCVEVSTVIWEGNPASPCFVTVGSRKKSRKRARTSHCSSPRVGVPEATTKNEGKKRKSSAVLKKALDIRKKYKKIVFGRRVPGWRGTNKSN